MTTINTQWLEQWMDLCATALLRDEERLTELDRQIGDGDHGINITRGFSEVRRLIEEQTPASLCEGLTLVAKTLLVHVGGASGPLYGTGFLRGGRAIAEHPDLGASETIALLYEAIAEGIAHRGNAEAGDKTMLDAWLPAAHAARDACEKGASVDEVLSSAAQAAQRGATLTEGMKALKGRASYLGERSVGHLDPGAVSSAIIIMQAARAAAEE
ncbi:dihydroxyacetone kinase subunit DhaL [Actinomyces sp. ph3]|uniref:dihydroxyacetone kinase subunit DhaL n=1 Tax=Actinomyces sp. ph3 TaxID=1118058 RepID=UPI0002DB221F|nr:dihydroxyacetone kinase subunit DhaL [Actinomyces sp. ph3]